MVKRHEWGSVYRRTPRRLQPRPRILIMCEGARTEPIYFGGWKKETRNSMVAIEIGPEGVDPKTLVQRAVERKRLAEASAKRSGDRFDSYDEVWCVFDRDEHPRFEEAKRQAHANGISVAISNPCFELWLLLHYENHHAHIERENVRRAFHHYHPKYEKDPPFTEIRPLYTDAVTRATKLDRWQSEQGCPGRNPYTGVYILTEKLRQLDRDQLLRRHRC